MEQKNSIISQLMCDQLLRKSQGLLGKDEANVYHAPEYRFRFSRRKKICSSGLELFLIQRLFEGKPYFRYLMSRRFCHRRAFFHLKNDSIGFYFLKMLHTFRFETDIIQFYFSRIHHTFCLLNSPQFFNPNLVIGQIAWSSYFGRSFNGINIDIHTGFAHALAHYGHRIGDPLCTLVLAMTNSSKCENLLKEFPDKESIYYHIAWAQAYLKGFCVPTNTEVFDKLRSMYWQVKKKIESTTTILKLREHNMLWNGSICLDAIWTLSNMTKVGLRKIQQRDPIMADRLISNIRGKTYHYPASPKYREMEKLLCGN